MSGGHKEKNVLLMLRDRWLSLPIMGGIICFGLALAAYSYVLSRMNLSVAYPIMTSMGFLFVIIASWMFFGENVTLTQVTGFVLIIAGVWMVAR